VGAEFAVLAARRARLEQLPARSRRARSALRAIEQLPLMISGCQFGITMASLGLRGARRTRCRGAANRPLPGDSHPTPTGPPDLAGCCAHPGFGAPHAAGGNGSQESRPGRAGAGRVDPRPAPAGFPGRVPAHHRRVDRCGNRVLRLLRITRVSEIGDAANRDAVAALIAESRQEGLLQQSEHELLSGALAFEERTAAAVLVPLTSLVCVPPDITPGQVETLVAETGYSRFPVQTRPDNTASVELIGYIHLADVLEVDAVRRCHPIEHHWIRPLQAVPATAKLQPVLASLHSSGAHLARVINEDGTTSGIIALEDVLEEIVGEVADITRRRTTP
jgi:CBS domain containing-hemolysin-like protein